MAPALSAGPLGEAIRLKAGGAGDASVIAYLQAHAAELPPVIDSEDVKQLRKAGAGKNVVAFLATVAAVDIGETGEGHEAAVVSGPSSPVGIDAEPYGMADAYGFSGGYATPYRAGRVPRGFPRAHVMAFPPAHRRIPASTGFMRRPIFQ